MTLDRENNSKGYSKSNCRWVSRKIQSNNRNNNTHVVYKGKSFTIAELAELANLEYMTVLSRIQRGWSIEDTVERPRVTVRK